MIKICGPILGTLGQALGVVSTVKSLTSSAPSTSVSAAPTSVDTTSGADAIDSQKDAKKKAAMAAGYQSTIKTGSTGDMSAATTNKKTLLGQ